MKIRYLKKTWIIAKEPKRIEKTKTSVKQYVFGPLGIAPKDLKKGLWDINRIGRIETIKTINHVRIG